MCHLRCLGNSGTTASDAAAMSAQAASMGRKLGTADAMVAGHAQQNGATILTRDNRFFKFLKAIGFSVEKF